MAHTFPQRLSISRAMGLIFFYVSPKFCYVLDSIYSGAPVSYGRNKEKVENWISIVSNGIKAAGVPEDKKLALLLDRDNLKARKGKIKLELFALKQTGDFDSFLSKFQELANGSGMEQEELIEPKTIEEAHKKFIAMKFEKNLEFIIGSLKKNIKNLINRTPRKN
ncbi:hypothetical protein BpHYR1_050690 [Brachionus plicatilis]|uniref:Uncharacterized protein n=1 Tax=Brachionus plicatilis TaxID=10195 RepID=A0A3M7RBG6_BRAPC|nr:hypothetical protein BpHYR1_050690 [Brachionus plicatilis]